MTDSPIDLCVLTDTHLLPWQVEAVERAVDEGGVRVSLVVVNDPTYSGDQPTDHRPAVRTAIENGDSIGVADLAAIGYAVRREGAWTLVLAERKVAWLLGYDDPEWLERIPVRDVEAFDEAIRIHCTPESEDGVWNELPDRVVDLVADEADVAVRFGFGLLRGTILDAPEHGVLSFHAADVRRYRGLGPDLSFFNGDDIAGATLQQLTERIDGGRIVGIETVDVSDARTSDEVRRRVYDLQCGMLARGIERLRDPTFEPLEDIDFAEYTPHNTRRRLGYSGPIAVRNLLGRVRSHSPTYRLLRRLFREQRSALGDRLFGSDRPAVERVTDTQTEDAPSASDD